MRNIVVTGIGRGFGQANRCWITFQISKRHQIYEQAVNLLNGAIYDTLESLKKIGIQKEKLKTIDFSMDTVNEYDENLNPKEVIEYIGSHKIGLEIENDGIITNRIIEFLIKGGHSPKIFIEFKTENQKKVKEEALVKAVIDGKAKGEAILKALGAKTVSIASVEYMGAEVSNVVEVSGKIGYDLSKAFEEILFTEKIKMIFELK